MTQAAAGILKILIFLIIGMVFKKAGVLKEREIGGIKKIVVYAAIPAVLFLSFARLEFTLGFIPVILVVFFINLILFWIGIAFYKINGSRNRLLPLTISTMNFALIGIPLYEAVYGLENLHNYTKLGIGNELYVWFVFFFFLHWFLSKGKDRKGIDTSILKSPIIWGIILGCLIGILKIDITSSLNFVVKGLHQSLLAAASMTTPLIMLFIGANISISPKYIRQSFKLMILRLVSAFVVGYLLKILVLNRLESGTPYSNAAFFLLISLPPVFSVPILASDYLDEDEMFTINNSIIMHALLTIVLFSVYTFFSF